MDKGPHPPSPPRTWSQQRQGNKGRKIEIALETTKIIFPPLHHNYRLFSQFYLPMRPTEPGPASDAADWHLIIPLTRPLLYVSCRLDDGRRVDGRASLLGPVASRLHQRKRRTVMTGFFSISGVRNESRRPHTDTIPASCARYLSGDGAPGDPKRVQKDGRFALLASQPLHSLPAMGCSVRLGPCRICNPPCRDQFRARPARLELSI